jgi:hypothetical protein
MAEQLSFFDTQDKKPMAKYIVNFIEREMERNGAELNAAYLKRDVVLLFLKYAIPKAFDAIEGGCMNSNGEDLYR